jgi:dihydrolipoamide dehydrogenase
MFHIKCKSREKSYVVTVKAENAKGEHFEGDYALVSVGRRPILMVLNADKAGEKFLIEDKLR